MYLAEGVYETRKGGIKGAQETLTAILAGFKALGRKTKPR